MESPKKDNSIIRELYADKIGSVHIIPKEKLIRFLSGKAGLMVRYKSDFHKKIIKEFQSKP